MPSPRLLHLCSLAELRAAAAAWDDLWQRTQATLPTFRAELLAQWVEQFAPGAEFHALVVEDQARWVAALPLVGRRVVRLVRAGAAPNNEWSSSGELLLDPAADPDSALDALVAAMPELPWPLLWLEDVALEAPRWRALLAALDRAGIAADGRVQYRVAWIPIDGDWESLTERWSRKHRQQMARHARRLAAQGDLRLELYGRLAPQEVEPWLRRGLDVEDRGWKGEAATSVLRTPGMFSFFLRQAEQLARWGQLGLAFLELGGRPIAFAYGLSAKDVFHCCKIGYDPRFAAHSPGQLLRYCLLREFSGAARRRAIDCLGPITDAHRSWRPQSYAMGRVVIAPRRLGRALLDPYRRWRRWRCGRTACSDSAAETAAPQRGVAGG